MGENILKHPSHASRHVVERKHCGPCREELPTIGVSPAAKVSVVRVSDSIYMQGLSRHGVAIFANFAVWQFIERFQCNAVQVAQVSGSTAPPPGHYWLPMLQAGSGLAGTLEQNCEEPSKGPKKRGTVPIVRGQKTRKNEENQNDNLGRFVIFGEDDWLIDMVPWI